MTIPDILAKQKASAEKFLTVTDGQKEIRIWAYDLKQMVREQLRLIEAFKYALEQRALLNAEIKELEMILLGVKTDLT